MTKAEKVLGKLSEKASVPLEVLMRGAETIQPGIDGRAGNVKVDLKDTTVWAGTKSKLFVGEGEKDYRPKVRFYNVKKDETPNVKRTPVRVDCNCRSYYFWFSNANYKAGAHEGKKDKVYIPVPDAERKRAPGPPKNPDSVPGLCKHLYRFVNNLIDSGLVED